MPVAEALARVLADAEPLAAEATPLADAHGRVLAADVAALRTQPPADVSAMDGYAVRSTDVARTPVKLKLVGEVAAGHPFQGAVGAGEAARIFTGGVLPPGTDTIVIQENTARDGDAVIVTTASSKGKHVRVEGLDFKRGEVLLAKGHRLTDRDLALAAEGLALSFWKVALRPGRPMMHGRLGATHVLGLPGNPVSAYVCAVLFLVPLIRRLCGRNDVAPALETARLGCDLPANDERADYLRAVLTAGPDGIPVAMPAPVQDSSMLMPLAQADCLLVREPFAPAAKAGERCAIIRLAA